MVVTRRPPVVHAAQPPRGSPHLRHRSLPGAHRCPATPPPSRRGPRRTSRRSPAAGRPDRHRRAAPASPTACGGSTRPPPGRPRPSCSPAAAACAGPAGSPRTAPTPTWTHCWPPPTRPPTTSRPPTSPRPSPPRRPAPRRTPPPPAAASPRTRRCGPRRPRTRLASATSSCSPSTGCTPVSPSTGCWRHSVSVSPTNQTRSGSRPPRNCAASPGPAWGDWPSGTRGASRGFAADTPTRAGSITPEGPGRT